MFLFPEIFETFSLRSQRDEWRKAFQIRIKEFVEIWSFEMWEQIHPSSTCSFSLSPNLIVQALTLLLDTKWKIVETFVMKNDERKECENLNRCSQFSYARFCYEVYTSMKAILRLLRRHQHIHCLLTFFIKHDSLCTYLQQAFREVLNQELFN